MVELQRLDINASMLDMPKTGLEIRINATDIGHKLNKIKEVVRCIIQHENRDLSSSEWKQFLPRWFVASMESETLEEIMKNSDLWEYESWIDAIKYRGWKWWKALVNVDETILYLETVDFPYNVDPFIYIIISVGVSRKDISIKEIL